MFIFQWLFKNHLKESICPVICPDKLWSGTNWPITLYLSYKYLLKWKSMSAQSRFPVLIVYLMSAMADLTDHSNRDLKQYLQQWKGVVSWLHIHFSRFFFFFCNGTLSFPILLWVSLFIAFFRLLFRRCSHVPGMRCLISVHTSSVRGNNKSQVTASINKMYWCPWVVNQSGVFGTCSQQWDTRCCCSVIEPAGKDSFLA